MCSVQEPFKNLCRTHKHIFTDKQATTLSVYGYWNAQSNTYVLNGRKNLEQLLTKMSLMKDL